MTSAALWALVALSTPGAGAPPEADRYEGVTAWRGPEVPVAASVLGVVGADRLFVLPKTHAAPATARRLPGAGPWPTGRVFVETVRPHDVARRIGARVLREPNSSGWALLDVAPARVAHLGRALVGADDVDRWAPDMLRRFDVRSPQDNELYSLQWHLENVGQRQAQFPDTVIAGSDIDAPCAWQTTTGDPSVIVAVIDTGHAAGHPDFASPGKIVAPLDTTGASANAEPPAGENGGAHGTAVAGLAVADSVGTVGVTGVCPECRLMPIRIFDALGFGSDTAVVDAFDHALTNGASVANNSWGYGSELVPRPVLEAIGRFAHGARDGLGGVVVFAIGNTYGEAPASEIALDPRALAIGGTGSDDLRVAYSTFSAGIDLVAPTGHEIEWTGAGAEPLGPQLVTTDILGEDGFNPAEDDELEPGVVVDNDWTGVMSGTSGAAPIAAGVAALLLSAAPSLRYEQVFALLTASAEKVGGQVYGDDGHSSLYGFGRIDACAALARLASGALCDVQQEVCDDEVDNDCDGSADGLDDECGFELPAPDLPFGEACDPWDAAGCGDGWCFASGFETDGVCATTCLGGVCAEGLCIETGDEQRPFPVCLISCETASDCDGTTGCLAIDGVRVCYPRCDGPESYCPAEMVCGVDGQCAPPEGPPQPVDAGPPPPSTVDGGTTVQLPGDSTRRRPGRVTIAAPASCAGAGGSEIPALTSLILALLGALNRRRHRRRPRRRGWSEADA